MLAMTRPKSRDIDAISARSSRQVIEGFLQSIIEGFFPTFRNFSRIVLQEGLCTFFK